MTSLVEIIKRSIRTQAKKNETPSAKQKIYTYMGQIENLYTNVRKEITDSNALKQADK